MPQMCPAPSTKNFDALHPVTVIPPHHDVFLRDKLKKLGHPVPELNLASEERAAIRSQHNDSDRPSTLRRRTWVLDNRNHQQLRREFSRSLTAFGFCLMATLVR